MTLPRRTTVRQRRDLRWRSPAHCAWVRGFVCCMCGSAANIAAAHVRKGSDAGMGRKPSDWRVVPLCDGPRSNAEHQLGCHNRQHIVGEDTFWREYEAKAHQTVEQLIDELCAASPKAREIADARKDRKLADGA